MLPKANAKTVDQQRQDYLDRIIDHVPQLGWTDKTLTLATRSAWEKVLFPSVEQALEAFLKRIDQAMIQHVERQVVPSTIRGKILTALLARFAICDQNRVLVEKSLSFCLRHQSFSRHATWRVADTIWSYYGDQSTGFSWHSKRLTLSLVYGICLLAWYDPTWQGEKRQRFIEKRLDNVIKLGAFKRIILTKIGFEPSSVNHPYRKKPG